MTVACFKWHDTIRILLLKCQIWGVQLVIIIYWVETGRWGGNTDYVYENKEVQLRLSWICSWWKKRHHLASTVLISLIFQIVFLYDINQPKDAWVQRRRSVVGLVIADTFYFSYTRRNWSLSVICGSHTYLLIEIPRWIDRRQKLLWDSSTSDHFSRNEIAISILPWRIVEHCHWRRSFETRVNLVSLWLQSNGVERELHVSKWCRIGVGHERVAYYNKVSTTMVSIMSVIAARSQPLSLLRF